MCDLSYAVLLERVEGDARTERLVAAVIASQGGDVNEQTVDDARDHLDRILVEDEAANVRHIDPFTLALNKALGVA